MMNAEVICELVRSVKESGGEVVCITRNCWQ